MTLKKPVYLLLALLLPGLIFVFLKYQGHNRFDIPVYHQEIVEAPDGCDSHYEAPYKVDLAELDRSWKPATATVIYFPREGTDVQRIFRALTEEFENEDFFLIDACNIVSDTTACAQWKKCFFLVKEPWHVVLVDKSGAIRGYYDLVLREEMDRLRVELKILLEKYQ